jgi:hypothetical protein
MSIIVVAAISNFTKPKAVEDNDAHLELAAARFPFAQTQFHRP